MSGNRGYDAASVPVGNPVEPAVATAELQPPSIYECRNCGNRYATRIEADNCEWDGCYGGHGA